MDARNLKYKTVAARLAQKRNRFSATEADSRELSDRLEAAEKAVEKFVARRIQPAVQKVGGRDLLRDCAGGVRLLVARLSSKATVKGCAGYRRL